MNIYISRSQFDNQHHRNKCVAVKIPYESHLISISLDSNQGAGDLTRGDVRVYEGADGEGTDITELLFPGEPIVFGTLANIIRAKECIDSYISFKKQ